MKIKTWIKYEESYLPPRCRKLRYKECEEFVQVTLREAKMGDLQLAFEDKSYCGAGKIYFYRGKLWAQAKLRCDSWAKEHGFQNPLDELIYNHEHCSTYFRFDFDRERYGVDTNREAVIKKARKDMGRCHAIVSTPLVWDTITAGRPYPWIIGIIATFPGALISPPWTARRQSRPRTEQRWGGEILST